MLTFKKSLAGDLLARASYLLGLRSHTDLVAENYQSQNLLGLYAVQCGFATFNEI